MVDMQVGGMRYESGEWGYDGIGGDCSGDEYYGRDGVWQMWW